MDKEAEITRLYEEYAKTAVLQPLASGRRLVPGYGPLDAPMVVVGEAPGAKEASEGKPFVGASGQRLRKLFRRADLPWELCYVMNVLPWRPPGNRTPYPFEVIASYQRVEAEIDVVQPAWVVTAGRSAWQAVTQNDLGSFSEARGRAFEIPWKDWRIIPVFHPSAILRAGEGEQRDRMEADTVRALRLALRESDAAGAA